MIGYYQKICTTSWALPSMEVYTLGTTQSISFLHGSHIFIHILVQFPRLLEIVQWQRQDIGIGRGMSFGC